MLLPREFYARPTLDVARDLIGKVLVHDTAAGVGLRNHRRNRGLHRRIRSGVPCRARPDGAQRAALRPAGDRLRLPQLRHPLPGERGDRAEGWPAAVLIRALEPLEGEALMRPAAREGHRQGRGVPIDRLALCRGPGNLTRALGISLPPEPAGPHRLGPAHRGSPAAGPGASPGAAASASTSGVEQEWRVLRESTPPPSRGRRSATGAGAAARLR